MYRFTLRSKRCFDTFVVQHYINTFQGNGLNPFELVGKDALLKEGKTNYVPLHEYNLLAWSASMSVNPTSCPS